MQQYILNDVTKEFSKEDCHHILNVLRMNDGDNVSVCFEDKCYLVKLVINDNLVSYEIINEIVKTNESNITLIQGNLKGSKIETTIKYATIFGARNIMITNFIRSIALIKNEDHKLKRYTTIAKEAAELSKREYVPTISFESSLLKLDFKQFDLVILADEEEVEDNIKGLDFKSFKNIAIIIGPEGGIDNKEREYLKSIKVTSTTLGNYIYPAEISALPLLTILNYK